jgi:hypothetical protein
MDIADKFSDLISSSSVNIDDLTEYMIERKYDLKKGFIEFFIRSDYKEKYCYNHEEIGNFLGYSSFKKEGMRCLVDFIKKELIENHDYIVNLGKHRKRTFMLSRIACYKICMGSRKQISKIVRNFISECYSIFQEYINSKNCMETHRDKYIKLINLSISDIDLINEMEDENEKESYYRDLLCDRFNGTSEVICEFGRIDVLTKKSIIEIKRVDLWKHALGQIIAYGTCYPNKIKKIAFYGDKSCLTENIMKLLIDQNVKVLFLE